MKLEIVTPEKKVYSDEVDQVSLPTPNGEITVLPHHIPLVTQVKPGELTVKKSGKTTHLVTGEGFVEFKDETISVLTDLAIESAQIDEKAADEARKRAQEAMKQKHSLSEQEFATAAANLEKALASLKVKRRHQKI